eukprot:Plantae.Rhodophyta-Rhodochaete_pulchella.ctg1955.p1 GENE.Plantae.Rhodophyta-Rhodochaete_pulchella.ctg1955~~Plantae.Rhodophyta-Rhodochaete_pulchella.ctg1955.p1  ORF type:complete len:806 (+),score=140.93 Plantae.Rhodophyta-Rhodochaete_pulchella.ctg1955:54-2420(+)
MHAEPMELDQFSSSAASSSSAPLAGAVDIRDAARTQKNPLWQTRPISEIAAESTVTCTDSYKRLPADFALPVCSGKNDLEKRTLNDIWVSVPSGSEDYSNKHLRKNPHEDNLFRCEDDRYELDMVIETNSSTIQKLEPIAATIAKLTAEDKKRYALADGALGAVHFRAIERIYGENGVEIVEQVRINPSVAVPVVLTRLKQKDEQWRKARLEMNKIWREVCEKNYYKALDHRSFIFKQTDKKELNSKSLRDDIHDPAASAAAKEQVLTSARGFSSNTGAETLANGSSMFSHVANCLELPLSGERGHTAALRILDYSMRWEVNDRKEADKVLNTFKSVFTAFYILESRKEWLIDGKPASERAVAQPHAMRANDDTPTSSTDGPTMYGDESIYILYRLEHILSERLAAARRMCTEEAQTAKIAEERNAKGARDLPGLANPASNLTQNLTLIETGDAVRGAVRSTDPEEIFESFMSTLHHFLSGSIDSQKYEDTCRNLLGTNCYVLFTMDKLVAKFVKQIISVFGPNPASEVTPWLIRLFEHERMRAGGPVETLYHRAASSKLGEERPTSCLYRLQRRALPDKPETMSLWVSLLGEPSGRREDLGRSRAVAEAQAFVGFRFPHVVVEDEHRPSRQGNAEDTLYRAFIRRTVNKVQKLFNGKRKAFEGCIVRNGLDLNMQVSNGHLVFVDATADLWFRSSKTRIRRGGREAGAKRFRKWLDRVRIPAEEGYEYVLGPPTNSDAENESRKERMDLDEQKKPDIPEPRREVPGNPEPQATEDTEMNDAETKDMQ